MSQSQCNGRTGQLPRLHDFLPEMTQKNRHCSASVDASIISTTCCVYIVKKVRMCVYVCQRAPEAEMILKKRRF